MNVSGVIVFNPTPGLGTQSDARPISLHVLIGTLGRVELWRLLDSIEHQLEVQDMVTVVFDGEDPHHMMKKVQNKLDEMPGFNVAKLAHGKKAFGDISGDSVRNMYQSRGGDFVLYADDDNFYEPDAFLVIRSTVQHDLDALYIFQVNITGGPVVPDVWNNANTVMANIDTGSGVVPTKYARHAVWENYPHPDFGYMCCGDHHFYNQLSNYVPRTYFIAKIIYVHTGHRSVGAEGKNGVKGKVI